MKLRSEKSAPRDVRIAWSRRLAAGTVFAVAMATSAIGAAQESKDACVEAYTSTQSLRKDLKLLDAKERALSCAQESCPEVVRTDCALWLGEIDKLIPTANFEVLDEVGAETTQVRVKYDGVVIADTLDGASVPVDPGEHTFTFELLNGAAPPIEEKVTIREGEKARTIRVAFGTSSEIDDADSDSVVKSDGTDDGPPVAAFVFGGVGLVGVGLFATFGLLGTSEKGDLEDTCAPGCATEDVDAVRTKLIIADISLAVGLVSLGTAVVILLTSGSDDAAAVSASLPMIEFVPQPGGGFATIGTRF